MKLVRMQFEGVGSFADRMDIDFESLGSAGLFLIEGPTGSGKSTILDALVYALYGSVAGQTGDLGRLDSQMRTGSPAVTVDFEVAGIPYRVHRVPGHLRAKQRGEGFTPANPKASLIRLDTDESLAESVKDVSSLIGQIIGLTKQQFVSTVVLAQGEFANFLDASTEVRAEILERVFGTEFFTKVEDQLAQMRKRANEQIAEAESQVDEAIHECLGALNIELVDDADALDTISAHIADVETRHAAALERAKEAHEHATEAQKAHAAAKERADQQQRKRGLLERQRELIDEEPQIAQVRQAVADHQRAKPVVNLVSEKRQADEGMREAERLQQKSLEDVRALGETQDPTASRLQEILDLIGQLRHPAEVEQDMVGQADRLALLQEDARIADERSSAAQQALDASDARIEELTAQLAAGEDVKEQIFETRRELDAAQAQEKIASELATKESEEAQAQQTLERAQRERDEAAQAQQRAQDALRADQAAVLAATLADGQPCIVCGSPEHPDPATTPAGLAGADPVSAQEELSRCDTALQAAKIAQATLSAAVASLREKVQTDDPGSQRERLEEILEDLTSRQQRRDAQTEDLAQLQKDRKGLADAAGAAQLAAQKAAGELESATQARAKAAELVTKARGDADSVADRLAGLDRLRVAVNAAVDAETALAESRRAARKAQTVLDDTLAGAGFSDAAQVSAAVLDDAAVEEHQERTKRWDDEVAAVAGALTDLSSVDMAEQVDLEGLSTALNDAVAAAKQADSEVTRYKQRLEDAKPRRDDLLERVKARDEVCERNQGIIRMADYATASPGEVVNRVRLSSFVLMRRFEDVVNAANDRLDNISEGRYQLIVETEGLDKRGQAGLDLKIYDARSERERVVRTLSGGERFYASLALALGLADVVRAEAGGVELGTLFIDEGFGSLDEQILAEVMDMLEQVRAGEDRVIGLISHVDLLKQRIDTRISVRRDPKRPGVSTLSVSV